MEIQTNHTVRLLNAKCEYVLIVDSLLKKLDYGESIECCINKLFVASRLINRLDCYCFENVTLGDIEVLSEFTITLSTLASDITTYSLAINGVYIANYLSDGSLGIDAVLEELLIQAGLTYSSTPGTARNTTVFTVTANCDSTSMTFRKEIIAGYEYEEFASKTPGVCTVGHCNNCIKESDLNELYSTLDQLLS
jgi:hypothetical protein